MTAKTDILRDIEIAFRQKEITGAKSGDMAAKPHRDRMLKLSERALAMGISQEEITERTIKVAITAATIAAVVDPSSLIHRAKRPARKSPSVREGMQADAA